MSAEPVRTPAQGSRLPEFQGQGDFFSYLSTEQMEAVLRAESFGEYTGERLFSQKPQIYDLVVHLLGQIPRPGLRTIAKLAGVSVNTVRGLRDNEPLAIDTVRAKTAENLAVAVLDMSERLRTESDTLPIAQVAMTMAISVDKLQLLTGGATQRVEIKDVTDIEDFNEYVSQLPKKAKVIDVPAMGLGGGNSCAKGEPDPGSVAPSDDTESFALPGSNREDGEDDTVLDTGSSVPADVPHVPQGIRGGEGVANFDPPPQHPMHSSTAEIEAKGPLSEPSPASGPGGAGDAGKTPGQPEEELS